MKAVFDRNALSIAFNAVASVAPARSPKPILQNVLLRCDAESTRVVATDLELAVERRVLGVAVDEPGAAVLPTVKFGSILRLCDAETLGLDADRDGLAVAAGRSKYKLGWEDPDDFPEPTSEPPEGLGKGRYSVRPDLFKLAIKRTAFATDPGSARYALGGVLIEPAADGLAFVATDGRRLAKQAIHAEAGTAWEGKANIVLPVKAAKLLLRLLEDDGEPVGLAFDANSLAVDGGAWTLWTRLVEGRFPRYQDVFPDAQPVRIAVGVGPLRQAVEQAAITTSDESRGVDFSFGEGVLTLAAQGADVGSSRVELEIPHAGPTIDLTLDPHYLADALKALGDESEAAVSLTDSASPAVLATGDDYSYVVMPMTREVS